MKRAFATVLRVGIGLAGLAGCGGGNRDPKQPRLDHDNNRHADDRSVAAQPGPTPEAEASASTCPGSVHATEVTGLTLPTANKKLSAAGFKADVSNTDTTFGILEMGLLRAGFTWQWLSAEGQPAFADTKTNPVACH